MTGKIGKSHPHFQAKHRVSAQFLAGGGITSLGLRFNNVASGKAEPSADALSKYSPLHRGAAQLRHIHHSLSEQLTAENPQVAAFSFFLFFFLFFFFFFFFFFAFALRRDSCQRGCCSHGHSPTKTVTLPAALTVPVRGPASHTRPDSRARGLEPQTAAAFTTRAGFYLCGFLIELPGKETQPQPQPLRSGGWTRQNGNAAWNKTKPNQTKKKKRKKKRKPHEW